MEFKLNIIINSELPAGLAANTAAVLALSMGKAHPDLIGNDLVDAGGFTHLGITTIPIPVLSATNSKLIDILERVRAKDNLELVSFTKLAQSIHTYDEYSKALSKTPTELLEYSGIAIFGDKKSINSICGSLPRL